MCGEELATHCRGITAVPSEKDMKFAMDAYHMPSSACMPPTVLHLM